MKHRLLPVMLGTVVSHGSRAGWVSPPEPSRHVRMFPSLSTQRGICVKFTHAKSVQVVSELQFLCPNFFKKLKCNISRVFTKAS